jgi:hypothetical protein
MVIRRPGVVHEPLLGGAPGPRIDRSAAAHSGARRWRCA